MKQEAGYAWRKYDCARPLFYCDLQALDPVDPSYFLWLAVDAGQMPWLSRWEGMDSAFLGFISKGLGPVSACAYAADRVLEVVFESRLDRAWVASGPDLAEAYEYLLANLLGVWMGEKTPFLVSSTPELLDILKKM